MGGEKSKAYLFHRVLEAADRIRNTENFPEGAVNSLPIAATQCNTAEVDEIMNSTV